MGYNKSLRKLINEDPCTRTIKVRKNFFIKFSDKIDESEGFYYFNLLEKKRILYLPRLNSKRRLFTYLHELGHYKGKHKLPLEVFMYGEKKFVIKYFRNEISSWRYVFKCIRREYYFEALNFCSEALASYIQYYNGKSIYKILYGMIMKFEKEIRRDLIKNVLIWKPIGKR